MINKVTWTKDTAQNLIELVLIWGSGNLYPITLHQFTYYIAAVKQLEVDDNKCRHLSNTSNVVSAKHPIYKTNGAQNDASYLKSGLIIVHHYYSHLKWKRWAT